MKNIFVATLVAITFLSCESNQQTEEESLADCEFPFIIVEPEYDTVTIGQKFRAKVYLSDSSYYFLHDHQTGKKVPVNPIFRVNGELVESPYDQYLIYEELVTANSVNKGYPAVREVSFGIIFPHPIPFRGDVEIGYRFNYVAVQ